MTGNSSEQFHERLQQLRDRFRVQLPERIQTVRRRCNDVLAGEPDDQQIAEVRVLVHNLAGSGATFGFAHVTTAARELEILFKRTSEFGVVWLRSQRNQVERYLHMLELASDLGASARSRPHHEHPGRSRGSDDSAGQQLVYFIDDDKDFALHITTVLSENGYQARHFTNLEGLEERLRVEPPVAILMDMGLPEGALAGAELLGRVRPYFHEPVPTVFVTVRDDFGARLEAVRAGGAHYLTKPLDEAELIATLDAVTLKTPKEPYRILLVDDDPALASLYEAHLSAANMRVKALHDPREAADCLERFFPELIVLDVHMPHCSGLELAAVIRQQSRYSGIAIVFLSTEADIDRQLAAMHLGGDDFLTKPIEPWRLVRSIHARAKRARDLREEMDRRKHAEESARKAYEILERRVEERTAQLAHQATHDGLTGLVNRYEFERRLRRVLTATADDVAHALLYLDLDQFKIVNDTCGHSAGDELLRQASVCLSSCIRQRDTIARLGGDEFGVLLERCPLEEAIRVANSLRCAAQDTPFAWDDQNFGITVSIGLVPLRKPFQTIEAALSAADSACYTAKERGRNRIHVYQLNDHALAQRHGEMQWVPRLQRALVEDRFCLYFQSILPVKSPAEDLVHGEILVRLTNDDGGIIPPGAFLPAAERYDQIRSLDAWVIKASIAAVQRQLAAEPDRAVLYSINISGQSLGDPEFLKLVKNCLVETQIPGAALCFEITETAAVSDLRHAMHFMSTLKEDHGCCFALDDFGRGLSSFGYLKTLPVDFLKIDGTFVKDLVTDHVDAAMVRAIHEIGEVMGIKTIAEWVESIPIFDKLKDLGVHYAQGYCLDRPHPLSY